jgi:hypothetical protein
MSGVAGVPLGVHRLHCLHADPLHRNAWTGHQNLEDALGNATFIVLVAVPCGAAKSFKEIVFKSAKVYRLAPEQKKKRGN